MGWLKVIKTRTGEVKTSHLGPIRGNLGERIAREVRNTCPDQATIIGFVNAEHQKELAELLAGDNLE